MCGAVLGLRLSKSVSAALNIEIREVTFWSDSMNVLYWVRNQSRKFKSFIANRVGEIHAATEPGQWKYVPTKLNPADAVTRGMSILELADKTSWWSGPLFLSQDPSKWPSKQINISSTGNVEEKKVSKYPNIALATTIVTYQEKESRLEPSRYSSWIRLTRVTAWVYRFISNCRLHKEQRYNGELQSEEFEDAEVHIIHRMQRIVFKEEYLLISSGKKLPNNSKLLYLNPVIDEDGLIRSNGRLEYADYLSYETKHPIIIPRKNWVTKLIVKMHHEKVRHFGTNQTLSSLSTKYWILQGREEIREWEKECQMCRRKKAKVAIKSWPHCRRLD